MDENEKFETKMKRLESIVDRFEKEEIGIEESLELFQEGIKLGKECRKILDNIELKVREVLKDDLSVKEWDCDV
ncbi:MAG: exodeoxyribonuclease VII small subunit [Deferribacterota bacterium]|nr:exodeoxyribonuclease VII small subunit [Deferribacterota bacterium]